MRLRMSSQLLYTFTRIIYLFFNTHLVSPQSLPMTQMYRPKHVAGSAPDDFVLVPYDVRSNESPKARQNRMFSPTERYNVFISY